METTALEKIEKAHQIVSELCRGTLRWVMSVPADPNRDPDLIISSALLGARERITALEAQLAEALPFLEAVKARHNGYDPQFCAELGVSQPATPVEALDELLKEGASMATGEKVLNLEDKLGASEQRREYLLASHRELEESHEVVLGQLAERDKQLAAVMQLYQNAEPDLRRQLAERDESFRMECESHQKCADARDRLQRELAAAQADDPEAKPT